MMEILRSYMKAHFGAGRRMGARPNTMFHNELNILMENTRSVNHFLSGLYFYHGHHLYVTVI